MIESVIYNYLDSVLEVPVYMEMPKNPPIQFVLFEKTGSSLNNCIGSATLAVQSHAESMYQAATLNEAVKSAMLNAIVLAEIASVRLNSDYNYTDGTLKDYRYQAVFDLTHYEV